MIKAHFCGWSRRYGFVTLAVVAALAIPGGSRANDEVPHEARGHEQSGYQLSNYENINLANGNLTFTIPLARLRTDGGLDYQLALRHNSKVWFTNRYCSLVPQGYEECEDAGGQFLEARIAHGVEEFGFGWDLRPPRVVRFRQSPFPRGMALVDTTGARHALSLTEPWNEGHGGEAGGSESSVGDRFFTRDGSNYRFTITAVDQAGQPIAMEMEDGSGDVYVFAHVVPLACDVERGVTLDDDDLEDFNFRVDRAGLYLSEIRRGPWRSGGGSGEPANRISFAYRGQAAGWDSPCGEVGGEQWLPIGMTADGEVPREVRILYDPVTSLLAAVMTPKFDSEIGNHGPSGEWDEVRLDVGSATFAQRNGGQGLSFEAAHLERVVFPNGATFELDTLLSGGFPPLSDVVLPSGARVVYGVGWYPVGKGRCLDAVEGPGGPCSVWAPCGATVPRPGEANAAEIKAEGVAWRDIEYLDAATVDGAPRVQSTWFAQGLNCAVSPKFTKPPNELHPWPYDFDWALRDDQGVLRPEYLWTVVYTSAGDVGPYEKPMVEIHRFHPLTREEFSVDYVTGDRDALVSLPLAALAGGTEDLTGPGVRVLRHVEIERDLRFGVDWPTLTEGNDRYSFIRETRVFTDEEHAQAGVADVESCYPPVFADLMGPPTVTIDCTEVRDTQEVDRYLNRVERSVDSERSAAGIDVSRGWAFEYEDANAEPSWFLHRERASEVCEDRRCARRNREWADHSDPGARGFWAPVREVSNPNDGGDCSMDCIERRFEYDSAGNLEASTVAGGHGSGFGELELTTRISHRHGAPVKKELQAPGESLLMWQREVDPNTGLARWHLSGSGDGFAYLWDGTGRLSDLAPIEGDLVSGQWQLSIQRAADGSAMLGSHIDYVQPTAAGNLLRHEVREAVYAVQGGADPRLVRTWSDPSPERRVHFDGLGRVTRRSQRYPGGSGTRSRLELEVLPDGSYPCGMNFGATPEHTTRMTLMSEWQDEAQWSSCDDLHWTITGFDALGRATRIVLPDGSDSELSWVGDSQSIASRTVAAGTDGSEERVATFLLTDALGRLRVVDEEVAPDQRVSADLDYDLQDRLVLVDLWQGEPHQSPVQRRTFAYSDGGFLMSSSEPERSVTFTGYDAAGNLRESVSGGVSTRLGYDGLGRLVSRWAAGVEMAWWSWGDDQSGGGAAVGEPSYGRIIRARRHNRFGVHDVPVTTTWSYQGPGARVSSKAVSLGGLGSAGDEFVTGHTYDRWGRTATVEHPVWSGWDATCQSTVAEHRSRLGEWLVGAEAVVGPGAISVAGLERSFLPSGRVASTGFLLAGGTAGGLDETPDPDGMARPAGYRLWWNGPGTLWTEGPYGYDGSGNPSRIAGRRYAYDGLDRLTAFTDNGAPVTSYDYDRWGNLAEARNLDTTNGGGYTLRLLDVEDDNRPSALEVVGEGTFPIFWDARGNLTSLPATSIGRGKSFVYSDDDRLLQVTDTVSGTTWRHAYDAAGERVLSWRRDGGGGLAEVRLNLRDEQGSVLSDWLLVPGSTFAPTRDYLRVDGRLSVQLEHGGGMVSPLFAAHDHLGSTRALVAANGTLLDQIDYLPYGGLRTGGPVPGTSHLFAGHERELGSTASELDFMHTRHYSPLLGRFTSIDSAGGDPASSQSWNRYAYTTGNPLRAVDRDGRWGEDVHYNLTRYLAVAAGWSRSEAVSLAAADKSVDVDTPAVPWNLQNWDRHFTTLARARLRFNAAASAEGISRSERISTMGRALHSVQDSFSHEGFGWPKGHLMAGKLPDKPWLRPKTAMTMAEETFRLLGGDPKDLDRDFLEAVFSVHSDEGRALMIDLGANLLSGGDSGEYEFRLTDADLEKIRKYFEGQGYRIIIDGGS